MRSRRQIAVESSGDGDDFLDSTTTIFPLYTGKTNPAIGQTAAETTLDPFAGETTLDPFVTEEDDKGLLGSWQIPDFEGFTYINWQIRHDTPSNGRRNSSLNNCEEKPVIATLLC